MANIRISTDSTCDLPRELIEKYNIRVCPMHVNLGDKTYDDDGTQLSPQMMFDYVKQTGQLPKTAAISMGEYIDMFSALTADGSEVVHIGFSSDLSVSFHNAELAAEELERVYTVNTKNLSTGMALLILRACELVEEGKTAQEIVDIVTALVPCVDASFVIDSLENLHKGGRCSAVAKLGANLLKLKPCITVKEGKMGVDKKYRGSIQAVIPEYVRNRLIDLDDIDLSRVFVTHTFGEEREAVLAAIEEVKSIAPFAELIENQAGCTISTHCGPRTLGVLFIRKSPIVK